MVLSFLKEFKLLYYDWDKGNILSLKGTVYWIILPSGNFGDFSLK